ncbi:MAG: hypothetical protein H0T85_04925 [Geodermatophilaceae bacterium]|nr:hypothetical protein [Geodermatophilaceae bacterium]
MTALLIHPPTLPSIDPIAAPRAADVRAALAELAAAASEAADGPEARGILGAAVRDLEQRAGADLGPTGSDPLVALQRRLGRVHGLLLRHGLSPDPADLRARALRLRRAG